MNVTCVWSPEFDMISLWRGTEYAGVVIDEGGEPQIVLYPLGDDTATWLTFTDINIIMENWNELQEQRANREE